MPLVFAWLVSLQAASDVGPVVAEATDPPNSQLDRIPPGTHSLAPRHLTAQGRLKSKPRPQLHRQPRCDVPLEPVCRRVSSPVAAAAAAAPQGKRAASLTRDEARASASAPPRLSTRRAQSDDNGAPHERRRHVDILEPRAVHAARGRARRHGAASTYLPTLPAVVLAHQKTSSKAVGLVHDQCRSSRLRETTEFPPAVRLAHATARRGGHELAEQTDVHLESFTYPKDAG